MTVQNLGQDNDLPRVPGTVPAVYIQGLVPEIGRGRLRSRNRLRDFRIALLTEGSNEHNQNQQRYNFPPLQLTSSIATIRRILATGTSRQVLTPAVMEMVYFFSKNIKFPDTLK
jgi:hypothetical protein